MIHATSLCGRCGRHVGVLICLAFIEMYSPCPMAHYQYNICMSTLHGRPQHGNRHMAYAHTRMRTKLAGWAVRRRRCGDDVDRTRRRRVDRCEVADL